MTPEYTYTLSAAERSYLRIALKAHLADIARDLEVLRAAHARDPSLYGGGIEHLCDKGAHLAQVLFKLSREG
jgi:hypothetical protein